VVLVGFHPKSGRITAKDFSLGDDCVHTSALIGRNENWSECLLVSV